MTEPDRSPGEQPVDWDDVDAELAATDAALSGSLRALLEPPADMEVRIADTVSQQLIGRSAAGTALDLLGLGVRTLAVILTDDTARADRCGDAPPRPDDGRRDRT